jgi:hypothetical protein
MIVNIADEIFKHIHNVCCNDISSYQVKIPIVFSGSNKVCLYLSKTTTQIPGTTTIRRTVRVHDTNSSFELISMATHLNMANIVNATKAILMAHMYYEDNDDREAKEACNAICKQLDRDFLESIKDKIHWSSKDMTISEFMYSCGVFRQ